MAQWIRPQTLNREVPGSNLLAAAVVPLGKALYPHCLVPRKGLKAVGPPGCLLISSLFSYWPGKIKSIPKSCTMAQINTIRYCVVQYLEFLLHARPCTYTIQYVQYIVYLQRANFYNVGQFDLIIS